MEIIASPAGAFGFSTICLLSIYIGANISKNKPIPQSETSIWVCCSIVGIFLLFLANGPIPIPTQGYFVIILLTFCTLYSSSVLVYSSFS